MKGNFTMPRLISSLLAVVLIGGTMVTHAPSAKAENGQIAAGVAGGLIGGALLGGALAGRPSYAAPPTYYAPAPVYVEEDEPVCRLVRQRFWDGYGYRIRRVQVCD
jgi:hypothetical protein